MLKLLALRGLTSYALTHIKQAPKDEFFTVIFFFFFCLQSTIHGICNLFPEKYVVLFTEIAFLAHYQMLHYCTGGYPRPNIIAMTTLSSDIQRCEGKGIFSVNLPPAL